MHASTLVRPFLVVELQVDVKVGLHLFDGLVPLLPAFDAEVLVEQRAVQAFDEAVTLRPAYACGAVLDLLQLQEQLIGVLVFPAAVLAAVVGQHGVDAGIVLLEEGQHVVVQDMYGRDRQLAGVEPAPGIAAVAVNDRLEVDFADTLQRTDEEGIDGHQVTGVARLDMPFAELWAEAFQQLDLLVAKLDLLVFHGLLQTQQPLVTRQQLMPAPDAANPGRADRDALQGEFLCDAQTAVGRELQAVIQDGLLDLFGHPVRVWVARPGQAVDQPLGAVGLVVPADLVELLPAVAHDFAGLADIAQISGQL